MRMSRNILPRLAVGFMLGALSCTSLEPEAPTSAIDTCLQRELFVQCLQSVPQGPERTVANDWDEVVHECRTAARQLSWRAPKMIEPECRREQDEETSP